MKSKIFLLVIVFVFLMVMGCATFAKPDICVTVKFKNSEEQICKNDAKGLPPDFPDDLFLKWFSLVPGEYFGIDFDDDNGPEEILFLWLDDYGKTIAILFQKVNKNKPNLAWAFVEVNNDFMEIKWVGKGATPLQIKFLNDVVHKHNQEYQA